MPAIPAPTFNHTTIRGRTYSFNLTVTTDGVATNLTGSSLRMTVKRLPTDSDGAALFALTIGSGITVTNAGGGLATVKVSPSNTSSLEAHRIDAIYDIELTDGSGNVYTIVSGSYIIFPNASITTP